jgi:nucleoside-diphosphate-sugar epimerase
MTARRRAAGVLAARGVVNVAITGATGFLGLHLVRELLRDQRNALILLAHAGSGEALSRVVAFLELTGVQPPVIAEALGRMRVVPVDVSAPRLGLAEPDFRRLAGRVDAVWHSAGNVRLNDDLGALRRVNVDGARHVLDLVGAGTGRPVLFHVSTAFVAGSRIKGTVYEDELDHGVGFENPYEQSKYEAEVLVREWSARNDRPVVVLRPGILVTGRPPHPDLPAHPLEFVNRSFAPARRLLGLAGPRAGRELPEVRLVGCSDGHLNFMPVEAAAAVMVRLSRRRPSGGVDTYHVVHRHDVPVPAVVEVFQHLAPVRLTLVPYPPADPTLLERYARLHSNIAPLLQHQRTFDDTRARAVLGEPGAEIDVNLEYLLSGLDLAGAGGQPGHPAAGSPGRPLPGSGELAALVPPGLMTHSAVVKDRRAVARELIGARSAPAPPPPRSLTFVVTAGRSGSTAVSAILRSHPEVLSLSEFFLCLRTMLPPGAGVISAATFWKALSAPHPVFDALVRGGAGMPEFLYPGLAGKRFNAVSGGIPAVCMTVLPHLSDNPDRVFDELAAEVPSWPDQPAAQHCARLFAWLAARFGSTVVVERSGFSLGSVPWMRRHFPGARFVHLHRNGPDSAVSMSRHTGFRLLLVFLEAMGALDLRALEDGAPELAAAFDPAALPIGLAPVLGDRYDRDYLMNLDLPVARFATLWSELVRAGVFALSGLPADASMTLSYEDLIADPQERLRELARFIGVTAPVPWLRASAAELDPHRAGAATRLPQQDLDKVRQRCKPGQAALACQAAKMARWPAHHEKPDTRHEDTGN